MDMHYGLVCLLHRQVEIKDARLWEYVAQLSAAVDIVQKPLSQRHILSTTNI